MNKINIFVSHRIDINSQLINNPLYIPVRCGAIFDHRENINLLGDDTGDNISNYRMSFCEFTVQYWAWKNVEADYYGLCHYRRFLAFSKKQYKTDEYNMIHFPMMTPFLVRKLGLINVENMRNTIQDYDIITSEYADVRNIPTPQGKKQTVYEHWCAHDGVFFEKSSVNLLLKLLEKKHPEYYASAKEYLSGHMHRGFNCYVMKKELFIRMCELQFDILFEINKRLNTEGYTQTMLRTPAFLGEILYGIFIYHIVNYEHHKMKELQLAFFSNTDILNGPIAWFGFYIWYFIDKFLRFTVDPFFPKGTQRREWLKNIFFAITPAKKRGIANPK